MVGKRLISGALGALLVLNLGGCATGGEVTEQIFAMDTIMTLTATGKGAEEGIRQAVDYVNQLENTISVTREGSELWAVNHSQGAWTALSSDTQALLSFALDMEERTGGALNIALYPALRLWGFTTGSYQVPEAEALEAALALTDLEGVELDTEHSRVRLESGMELDLGAVAKGYAGDRMAELLRACGVESAILNLGGNVQTVGKKPDGSLWRIGIQDPQDESGYLAALEVEDCAVVTSGGYQRYFEQDGETYWHILDPETGAPARSGLISVTVTGPSGAVCDALSTSLFVMGLEEASDYWRENRDLGFEAVLVSEDGSIAVTQGLTDAFTLAAGYENREVAVIEP